jgi:CrcB protein
MMRFFLICAGGALGTGARYLVSMGTAALFGTSFPYGTLAVNLIGSFLMGILLHAYPTGEFLSPAARIILTAGVMGGFTTYSSFNAETLRFLQDGDVQRGVLNAVAMFSSCLIAGWAGVAMAGRFFAR